MAFYEDELQRILDLSGELSPEQERNLKLIFGAADSLLSYSDDLPHSRYKSLFQTSLEQAMVWIERAIVYDSPAKGE